MKENRMLKEVLNNLMEEGKSKRTKFKKLTNNLEELRQSAEGRTALFDRN